MPYRTLGDLRSELRARLGMSASGSAAGVNQTLLDSFLRNGQKQIYAAGMWKRLHRYEDKEVGVNQYLVDYPAAADPDRILQIGANIGTDDTPNWIELKEGISLHHYNTQHMVGYPQRYRCYEQIELWPKNDAIRDIRIFYVKALDPFTQDGHRATIDDDMVLLHAIANAKLHYRQPDAQTYGNQLETLLVNLRSISWPKYVFNRTPEADIEPRPKVV